jgi:two-component system nitrogen regulation sensor histidine kinase NtrY
MLGEGMAELFSPPWPVAGERRAKRGSHPLYPVFKRMYVVCAALAMLALGGAAWWAAGSPTHTASAMLITTIALVVLASLTGLYVLRRMVIVLLDRRGQLQGRNLRRRMLLVFTAVTLFPALAVGVVGIVIFNRGIDGWFTARIEASQTAGQQLAEGYLTATARGLQAEAVALAADPLWQLPPLLLSEATVATLLRSQQAERNLAELVLTDDAGQPLASASGFPSPLPTQVMTYVQSAPAPGRPEAFRQADGARLYAAVPLRSGYWLVAERALPSSMQEHLLQLDNASRDYRDVANTRAAMQRNLTWLMVLLLLGSLALAAWAGARLSAKLAGPITALVHATNRVSAGDLSVRLTPRDDNELGVLTQAFNRMTYQLAAKADLVERKNTELDERRRLNEAVLLGVSAGVVAVDEAGVVRIVNPSATSLLGLQVGDKLSRVSPELSEVLRAFHAHLYEAEIHQRKLIQSHTLKVDVVHAGHEETRTLQVRLLPIGGELGKGGVAKIGVVLTFDDITPLVGAQRLAAWQDVARRLAHEIKNPLTPIQLSAARMKRKFLATMAPADQPLFGQLADTIVNATEDMRRMVNEFSDFARMPQAQKEPLVLADLAADIVALHSSREGVQVLLENHAPEVHIAADAGQLRRALTNLIENAINAVNERDAETEGTNLPQGRVQVVVQKSQPDKVTVEIHDNGRGLPEGKEVGELFDPYVTTRKHGTGLGLAIVKKVMDEHGGTVRLARRNGGGTTATLTLSAADHAAPTPVTLSVTKKEKTNDHSPQASDTRDSDRRRRGRHSHRTGGDT